MIWVCEHCGAEIESRRKLYKHKREDHKIKNGQAPKYDLKCKYCGKIKYTTRGEMTRHEMHCEKNPNKLRCKGHKNTEAICKRISLGMEKAHREGRASSWIGRRKRSYAEQSWFNIFTNENVKFENNYYVKPYWLDFAWPDKKLYFEVDGRTHYTAKGKLHDEERTENLKEQGWTLLGRCNWSEYQHLSKEAKRTYIEGILSKLL